MNKEEKCKQLEESAKEKIGDNDYDAAIHLDPDNTFLWYERGEEKYKLGLYEAAIEDFDKAISLNPNYIDALYLRGLTKHKLGLYEAAIADFYRVINLNPNHEKARNSLSEAKEKLEPIKRRQQDQCPSM